MSSIEEKIREKWHPWTYYSFIPRYSLSSCYVPGTLLDATNMIMSKTDFLKMSKNVYGFYVI